MKGFSKMNHSRRKGEKQLAVFVLLLTLWFTVFTLSPGSYRDSFVYAEEVSEATGADAGNGGGDGGSAPASAPSGGDSG